MTKVILNNVFLKSAQASVRECLLRGIKITIENLHEGHDEISGDVNLVDITLEGNYLDIRRIHDLYFD